MVFNIVLTWYLSRVLRNSIPQHPVVSPTRIGVSDKKDYVVKLKSDTGDTSENIIGLRLYLGCHKDGDNNTTTSNCRLSVIRNSNQHYSAIDPINPCSNDTDQCITLHNPR